MARSEKLMTPKFRVSFPNVFRPAAVTEGQEPKYSITALFEPGQDLSALKAAATQVTREEWGESPPANLRSPFKDQGEKAKYEGYEPGAICITATSKRRPGVVDVNVVPIIDESDFYPGCYAQMTVVAYTYERKGIRPGVGFAIQNIQKLADGEPLGGGSRPEDDFEPVAAAGVGAQREDVPW